MIAKDKCLFQRDAGVLMHVSSLPTDFGIGDFGPAAFEWLAMLESSQQNIWQILPLGPAGYGNSPYQALSAFACNPMFLSPESLAAQGLLGEAEVDKLRMERSSAVDFLALRNSKQRMSLIAGMHFHGLPKSSPLRMEFVDYVRKEADWLEDFALFTALKSKFGGGPWFQWPKEYRLRDSKTIADARLEQEPMLAQIRLEQFLLHRQWQAVRSSANERGIRIVGDLPIFVAHDSVDVWCNPELFELDANGVPTVVAGVPPDYFSSTGQLWGNPLYNWERHESDGFAWWQKRIGKLLEWVDIIRIDHFRGFAACWQIPGEAKTAMDGSWVNAPGMKLFEKLKETLGNPLPFIAEDLGVITKDVTQLRDHYNLPGIRLMQFAFGTDPMRDTFIPESFTQQCAAYTGTHDNDTVQGWFNSRAGEGSIRSMDEIVAEREAAMEYFGTDGEEIHRDFIKRLYESDAGAAIVPIQDVMGLGSEARMNTPGQASGSWGWRLPDFSLVRDDMEFLNQLSQSTSRGVPSQTLSAV